MLTGGLNIWFKWLVVPKDLVLKTRIKMQTTPILESFEIVLFLYMMK